MSESTAAELTVTDSGELDLGLPPALPRTRGRAGSGSASRRPSVSVSVSVSGSAAAAGCTAGSASAAVTGDPAGPEADWSFDDWIDSGWVPGDCGDPETDPDDTAAWLAGLPPQVRADYEAGPWTGAGELIPAGFTHHLRQDGSAAGFGSGGALDTAAGSSALAAALDLATGDAGHRLLGESELIGVLCGWRRVASWAGAGEAGAVAELARRRDAQAAVPGSSRAGEHVADEVAAALTLTGRSAGRLLETAAGLARLPGVHVALASGAVDWPKAGVLTDELAVLDDDEVARDIAARLLLRAPGWTTGQLRAAARREVLAADPDAVSRRQDEGRKDAAVQCWDEASGNGALAGRELPPAEVIAADARLTALAQWLAARGAAGTISQLRAAVYTALLAGRQLDSLLPPGPSNPSETDSNAQLDGSAQADGSARSDAAAGPGAAGPGGAGPGGGGWPGLSGSVHLTMPVSAWLGGGHPGEVAGHGTLDAGTCRVLAQMLAADPATQWCLTVTGPDGQAVAHACAADGPGPGELVLGWAAGLRSRLGLLEHDTCAHARQGAGYRPGAVLRHLVCVRQRTCSFPGCRRPAVRCDLDHTLAFEDGGLTCECNLSPLCRRHHQAKQAPGWRLTQLCPGEMTWRTPSGRTYHTTGPPYLL